MAMRTNDPTEYERQRLDNIRRNEQMVLALMLKSKAADLRPKPDPLKRPKSYAIDTPRRSLRASGFPLIENPTLPFSLSPCQKMALRTKDPTEYERQRLDNIRRNEQMVLALMLKSKAADLRPKPDPLKRPKPNPKPKSSTIDTPRRSLRARGIPPIEYPTTHFLSPAPKSRPTPEQDPLTIKDAGLIDAIKKSTCGGSESGWVKSEGFDPILELGLRSDNVKKVVGSRITSIGFLPFVDRTVVVVGNAVGNLGFWDVDSSEKGEGSGIYVYRPHSLPLSGVSVHPFAPRKIFTSSFDGNIRLMDVEKESFNVLTSSDYGFFCLCQWPQDVNSLHIGEGGGTLRVWDANAGKASSCWELHEARINTVDFNSQNVHLMTTSSTDGSACIWDLRYMKKDKPGSIKLIDDHHNQVHSSYFSPSGSYLATTSLDNTVGIASGANFDDISMISHNNRPAIDARFPALRAIWGWDDSCLFIGNIEEAIDVISPGDRTTTALKSEAMPCIPRRIAVHPYRLGHLACAARRGMAFLWTRE